MAAPGAGGTGWWARLWRFAAPRTWWAAVLGGLCGALAYEPFNLRALIALTPVLLFVALRSAPTAGGAFRRLLLGGWLLYFGGVHWLLTLTQYSRYIQLSMLVPLAIPILALYMALYPALIAYVVRKWLWRGSLVADYLSFAALWLLAEWFRTLGRLAMPLVQLGHAWSERPVLIQHAELLGELGVTLGVLLAGGAVLFAWDARRGRARPSSPLRFAPAVVCAVLFGAIAIYGALRFAAWDGRLGERPLEQTGPERLDVALLQHNINQHDKLASYAMKPGESREDYRERIERNRERMLEINEELAARAAEALDRATADRPAPRARVMVLPESAVTSLYFAIQEPLRRRVGRMAERADAHIVLGANRVADVDLETYLYDAVYNSAWLLRPDGTIDRTVYDKLRLVPFGEYIPYLDMLPGMVQTGFHDGEQWTLFNLPAAAAESDPPPLQLATLICFESTFAQMTRDFANRGADLFAVITNDGWYQRSAGAAVHHHCSLLRAVETRRWILRAANTGISSVIAPSGRALASLPLGERDALIAHIDAGRHGDRTGFMIWGNVWLLVPLAWVVGVAAMRIHSQDEQDFEDQDRMITERT